MKRLPSATMTLLVLAGTLQAQEVGVRPAETPTVAAVLAINERLSEAALAGDVEVLQELLSEDLVVSDPGNRIRHRDDLLALFAKRGVAYRSMETTVDYAGEVGDLVVVMGMESTVLESAPEGSPWRPGTTLHRRFTNVFRQEAGSWRLVIKQSTVFSAE